MLMAALIYLRVHRSILLEKMPGKWGVGLDNDKFNNDVTNMQIDDAQENARLNAQLARIVDQLLRVYERKALQVLLKALDLRHGTNSIGDKCEYHYTPRKPEQPVKLLVDQ